MKGEKYMKNFFLKRTLLQLASMGFLFVLLLAPTRIYMTGLISLDFSPSFMSDIFISVIDVLLVFLLGFILYKKDKITKPNLIAIIMASVIGALLLQSFVTLLIVDNFTFNYFLSSVSKLTRFLLMVGFVVSLIKFKILSLEDFEIILVLSIMILVLVSPISMIVFEIYGEGIGRGYPWISTKLSRCIR